MPHSQNSNGAHGSSHTSRAADELDELVRRYNRQSTQPVDPSLNDVIYMVVRIAASIQQDRGTAGWQDLVRETRRRLYSKLNLAGLVKEDTDESEDPEL